MSIGMPYPVYGYLYDSNGNIVASGSINLTSGSTTLTIVSNSGGKYIGNIDNYAYSGCTMNITSTGYGEDKSSSFKVVISDRMKNLNISLEEANDLGDIYINTNRDYDNNVYIFNSWNRKGHSKTSDYGN